MNDRIAEYGAATRFQPGNRPTNSQHGGLVPLIRRLTRNGHGDGGEIVGFMLAIMRGEVDTIYPKRPEEEARRRRVAKQIKGKKGAEAAQVAEALSELLKPSRPRHLKVTDRMAAAVWLANRGFGRTPLVIKMEEDRKLPFDPSQLTLEEQREMRRLLEKGRPVTRRVIDVTPEGAHTNGLSPSA